MPATQQADLADLPPTVQRVLSEFIESARGALGSDLVSAVLYGSAAEGRLRATSDVNLALVLSEFDVRKLDPLREPLRIAQAAIKLAVLFILKSELSTAADSFAVKFADIQRRRRVLYGEDSFASLMVSRAASRNRLKQVLLNIVLRLRAAYVLGGLREEQSARVIAGFAGPLRTAAASLLELEEQPVDHPKEALRKVVSSLPQQTNPESVLADISAAREHRPLAAGRAASALLAMIEWAKRMHDRAARLK